MASTEIAVRLVAGLLLILTNGFFVAIEFALRRIIESLVFSYPLARQILLRGLCMTTVSYQFLRADHVQCRLRATFHDRRLVDCLLDNGSNLRFEPITAESSLDFVCPYMKVLLKRRIVEHAIYPLNCVLGRLV